MRDAQPGESVFPTDNTAKYAGIIVVGAILALVAIRYVMETK